MNKIILSLMCAFFCINSPLKANEDLLQLFHLAVEHGDVKLIKEVIDALIKDEANSKNLLDALAKYSEKGKMDFALHNAIKDKNLLSSVILTHHSKDVNTSRGKETCNGAHNIRDSKTPIELAFEADMIELIPYLLMKNANPYRMRSVAYVYEDEENTDYLKELGVIPTKKTCMTTKKAFFDIQGAQRTLIGDAIVNDRLDVIKILGNSKIDWNKHCFMWWSTSYTPLQFSIAIKRYDIAQFLIDHGARIE